MIGAFEHFIALNNLFSKRQKVLLGVSGGIDSVVMCHLFKKLGYKFAIAHCNFSLRGEESDKDAIFVRPYAGVAAGRQRRPYRGRVIARAKFITADNSSSGS